MASSASRQITTSSPPISPRGLTTNSSRSATSAAGSERIEGRRASSPRKNRTRSSTYGWTSLSSATPAPGAFTTVSAPRAHGSIRNSSGLPREPVLLGALVDHVDRARAPVEPRDQPPVAQFEIRERHHRGAQLAGQALVLPPGGGVRSSTEQDHLRLGGRRGVAERQAPARHRRVSGPGPVGRAGAGRAGPRARRPRRRAPMPSGPGPRSRGSGRPGSARRPVPRRRSSATRSRRAWPARSAVSSRPPPGERSPPPGRAAPRTRPRRTRRGP